MCKVVILAGGHGTRISEETEKIPKPLVKIGDYPIIWHIMKQYSHYGFNEFIICLGYKGHLIKEYFHHYYLHSSDVTIDLGANNYTYHRNPDEDWKITLVDTGLNTLTAGRISQIERYIDGDDFMLTYGDGVSNISLAYLLEYHKEHKKIATCSTVKKAGRFGSVKIDDNGKIINFDEKPIDDESWINGGFFVFNKKIFDYLDDKQLEQNTLPNLTRNKQLMAYKHSGFWKCMDTLGDKLQLEKLWKENPPWKIW